MRKKGRKEGRQAGIRKKGKKVEMLIGMKERKKENTEREKK